MTKDKYDMMAPFIENLENFIERVEQTSGEDAGEMALLRNEAEMMVKESTQYDDPIIPELIVTLKAAMKTLEASVKGEEVEA